MELSPKEKAYEISKAIFEEQHTDTGAKMILLSTPKIALLFADEMIAVLGKMNSCMRSHTTVEGQSPNDQWLYWIEVKKEMELFFEYKNGIPLRKS